MHTAIRSISSAMLAVALSGCGLFGGEVKDQASGAILKGLDLYCGLPQDLRKEVRADVNRGSEFAQKGGVASVTCPGDTVEDSQ